MSKIKIKDIEGDATEIKNLFKDMGCDLSSYIEAAPLKKTVPQYWLWLSCIIFFINACSIWSGINNHFILKICTLSHFLLLGVILIIIHYNHEKWAITSIAAFTGLCVTLITLEVYTPKEIAGKLENSYMDKISNK